MLSPSLGKTLQGVLKSISASLLPVSRNEANWAPYQLSGLNHGANNSFGLTPSFRHSKSGMKSAVRGKPTGNTNMSLRRLGIRRSVFLRRRTGNLTAAKRSASLSDARRVQTKIVLNITLS